MPPQNFTCNYFLSNDTSQCAECLNYTYEFELFDETVNSEFDLICEDEYKSSLISTLSLAALFFGAIGIGAIGDRYGRRNALLVASGE